jgi:hypothetical protein
VSVALACTALVAGGSVAGCSDEQAQWCDRLADQGDLAALVGAVAAEDPAATETALAELEELAASAPPPVREEMDQVVEVLSEVVELRLGAEEMPAGELENQRARVNQRLEDVAVPTAAVGRWAETECGITLD